MNTDSSPRDPAALAADAARLAHLKRVVIYRLGSLGDTVVALPCFNRLAQLMPNAERIVLTNLPVSAKAAPLEAVLGDSGLIHRTIAYPINTRSLTELWNLRRQLKSLGTDTLIYLTPARGMQAAWRDVLYFRWCGFKHIIGAPLSEDDQQPHVVNAKGDIERECVRLSRRLSALGPIDVHDPTLWDLHLTPAEYTFADRATSALQDKPFIAINMGGKVAKNDWGTESWTHLLGRLGHDLGDHGLMVIGGAEDNERAMQMCSVWGDAALNLCGQLTPRQSAAAMRHARLFVGHDSGPLHLAAAMGVPCVGLFGDNNPPCKWHPVGARHRILHCMQGVQAIGVDAVRAAVEVTLQANESACV